MQISTFILILFQQRSGGEFLFDVIFSVCSPGLFIGFVFLLIIGLFVYNHLKQKKRSEQFQQFAAQNGWTFAPNAVLEFFPNAQFYSIFSSGHSKKILRLIHKPLGSGEQIIVFDYRYTTGGGRTSHTHYKTVVALFSPRLQLPFFALYPESFLSFIGEMVGYNDIDFTTHPHFSSRYKLSGRDEILIRQTFHPVLNHLDHLPTVNIDGGGNYIFAYMPNEEASIENLNAFVNGRMTFLNLFRR